MFIHNLPTVLSICIRLDEACGSEEAVEMKHLMLRQEAINQENIGVCVHARESAAANAERLRAAAVLEEDR